MKHKNINILSILQITLAIAIIVWLTYITLIPVEVRWAFGDCLIVPTTTILYVFVITYVWLTNEKIPITLTDTLIFIWFGYYVCRTWLSTDFSAREFFLKTSSIFLLYYSLHIIFGKYSWVEKAIIIAVITGGFYEAVLGILQIISVPLKSGPVKI